MESSLDDNHPSLSCIINGTLALHGLVRDDVEQLTDAAIRIRRMVPVINVINDVKPEGNLLL